jgi:hypothetical protein
VVSFAAHCNLSGPRSKYIATGRYVDDVIFMSKWFCSECSNKMLLARYASEISFDVTTDVLSLRGVTVITTDVFSSNSYQENSSHTRVGELFFDRSWKII